MLEALPLGKKEKKTNQCLVSEKTSLVKKGRKKLDAILRLNYKRYISSYFPYISSVQFSSVPQSCLTLCDPMDCSTLGFCVHYQLLELAQTPVHRVSDAIQPSHPLSSPSPPAFTLAQHQGLF